MENFKAEVEFMNDNYANLINCRRHNFSIDATPEKPFHKTWKCENCGGEVSSTAKRWFELGILQAGRERETANGRETN